MAMLPFYLRRGTSKIHVKNIVFQTNFELVVATLQRGREEKLYIIQITRHPSTYWRGQVLEVIVQATTQHLEIISETITAEINTLILNLGGRHPRCFGCEKRVMLGKIVKRRTKKRPLNQRRLLLR